MIFGPRAEGKTKNRIGFTNIEKIKTQYGIDGVIVKTKLFDKEFKLENQKGRENGLLAGT